ncbi:MAG: CDP-alcohol phosphatidyltransferase family protein [bacterium]
MASFDKSISNQFDINDERLFKKTKKTILPSLSKPTDGPVSKYLNRPISNRISKILVNYDIEPNHITIFSFIIGVLAVVLFYTGQYVWILVGGVLVQVSSILDGCDGEIARLKFKQSRFGAWFDKVLDRYADGLIILGITHVVWLNVQSHWVLLIGFGALIGSFMTSYTAPEFDKILKKDLLLGIKHFRFGRDLRLFIIFVGAVFNQLFLTLMTLTLITNLESIRRLIIFRNAFRFSHKYRKRNRTNYPKIEPTGRFSTRAQY